MQKSDAKAGMKVVFGRGRGEKTVGKIVRCGPKNATVETLEERGRGRGSDAGSRWKVPYALMEPLPKGGSKEDVEITGGRPQVDIVPGETTFRYGYADGNPLWKVLRSKGRDVYLCEIVNEKIEINGQEYDCDFAGTQKVFMGREIAGAIGMSDLFEGLANEHERFYKSLKEGQTIHYQNGFDNWVRCVVVKDGGENKLKPVALVGEWREYDLPRRYADGTVYNGHYADMILKGELFTPNASNLFEHGCKPRNGKAPGTLKPINLELPPQTDEEKRVAALWQQVHRIKEVIEGTEAERGQERDPAEILKRIKTLV